MQVPVAAQRWASDLASSLPVTGHVKPPLGKKPHVARGGTSIAGF